MDRSNLKKTKDGRYLYPATCSKCGCDRGHRSKKSLISLCRSCSAVNARTKTSYKGRSKDSYLPSDKLKVKYPNVNLNCFKLLPCGVKTYQIDCPMCGVDKGFHILQQASYNCRNCMGKLQSGKKSPNINWKDSTIHNGRKLYRQTCLHCVADAGYKELKQFDSPCKDCQLKGIRRIRENRKKIKSSMKSSIYHRLKSRFASKNRKKTFDMLPYTLSELIAHLESKFTSGMSWDNYGEWHIDHITPDSWFQYTCVNDQGFKDSWALSNLQPLWAIDNLKKSNKYSG